MSDAGTANLAEFVESVGEALGVHLGPGDAHVPLEDLTGSGVGRTVMALALRVASGGRIDAPVHRFRTLADAHELLEGGEGTTAGEGAGADPGAESPVWLRPVVPADVDLMYQAAQSPTSAFRWRFTGLLPGPREFHEVARQGLLAQLVVERKSDASTQGIVMAHDYMPDVRICSVGFQRLRSDASGDMSFGMFHLIEYLFRRWDLRKVYADVPEFNLDQVNDGFGILSEEGRLKDFRYYGGRWWDRVFLSITRERWEQRAAAWRPWLREGLKPDE